MQTRAFSRRPAPSLATPERMAGEVAPRRRVVVALAGAAALAGAWAGAATWYILARDEVAQTLFARQAEVRYGFEDRIAELRRRLEHEITKNLVERNGFAARTDALAARQREIDARQAWLADLIERLGGAAPAGQQVPASDEGPASQPRPAPAAVPPGKPAPLSEAVELRRALPGAGEAGAAEAERPLDRLSALEGTLRRTSSKLFDQTQALAALAGERAIRVRTALEATRLDPARLQPRQAERPAGGPLVPAAAAFDAGPFAVAAAEAEARLTELEGLTVLGRSLPLARPVPADNAATSGFGYRIDPFTRGPAFHTGLDFRAEPGSAVRATGAGRVVTAEYVAGYGNMVEIEHGAGVSTRYGHLSRFAVTPGAQVAAGEVIGRAGSTGRSTGVHLHYETRLDGEPVNPTRFLKAGEALTARR